MKNLLKKLRVYRYAAGWCILAGVLCTLPSLSNGLNLDDRFHALALTGNNSIPALPQTALDLFSLSGDANRDIWIDQGLFPWWTASDLKISFFRPLAGLFMQLDYSFWPEYPFIMHIQNLAWYALAILLLFKFVKEIESPLLARWAAFIFAVDEAHGFTVGWLANRSSIIGTTLGLLSLYTHHMGLKNRYSFIYFLSPVALFIGLLASEATIAFPGFLLAYALFIDRRPKMKALAELIPHALVCIFWIILYKIQHYGSLNSGIYLDPFASPLQFLSNFPARFLVYATGSLLLPPSEIYFYLPTYGKIIHLIVGICLLGCFGIVLASVWRKNPSYKFWLMGTILAIVPLCSTAPDNRNLMATSTGSAAIIALCIYYLGKRNFYQNRTQTFLKYKTFFKASRIALISTHFVLAPLALLFLSRGPALVDALVAQINSSLPQSVMQTNKQWIIIHAPLYLTHITFATAYRASQKMDLPRNIAGLYTGPEHPRITQPAPNQLLLQTQHGFIADPLDSSLRASHLKIKIGQKFKTSYMQAEVLAITVDGRPATVLFTFPEPLNSDQYEWFIWTSNKFVRYRL